MDEGTVSGPAFTERHAALSSKDHMIRDPRCPFSLHVAKLESIAKFIATVQLDGCFTEGMTLVGCGGELFG